LAVTEKETTAIPPGVHVVDEERMRPDNRSELMLCIPFSAVALMVGRLEGHPARENPVPVKKGKGKGFPYSIPSVGPGADPGVQAVSLQVTVKSSTRR